VATQPGAAAGVSDEAPISLYAQRPPRLRGTAGTVASTVSTIVLVGAIVVLFLLPSSAGFRHEFFSPHYLWESFRLHPSDYLYSVSKAFLYTVLLSVICEPIVLVLALAVATLRMTTGPVLKPFRGLCIAYTDFARGVPLILIMLWVGFGIPELNAGWISSQSVFVYGGMVLVFTYTAYVSEVVRAGIYSVPRSQASAARSLGLSSRDTLARVVVPQAVRNVLPALLNDFVSLQKDTAIVSVLGAVELTHAAQADASYWFNSAPYAIAAGFYLLLTVPLTRYTDRLLAKDRDRRLAGSA
jgi:polar amino acid transport system permease protein